jgi:predicted alpha/beta superfamily hydrolase
MKPYITFLFLLLVLACFAQELPFRADTIRIKSAILNEERSVVVYKSVNWAESGSVKFLYLLDGEFSGYRVGKLYEQLKDSCSDLIIIGIINTDRRRDLLYAFGADHFLGFITSELIPTVEKRYNVKRRILFGHSFAGSFTLYALISQPSAFNGYIASSPTPIMDLVDPAKFMQLDSTMRSKTPFFFSYGSKDMAQVRKWTARLKNNLTSIQLNHLDWRSTIFEGKTHNNSDIDALIKGVQFAGY